MLQPTYEGDGGKSCQRYHVVQDPQSQIPTGHGEGQGGLDTLRVKYEMGKTQIKAIVAKHQFKLSRKVEEALARGWNEWAAQVAELQVFRVDAENRQKEGRGFYKMDKKSIQILHEDLTEEFQALACTHTTAIGTLLEEFNNDQLLLAIEMKGYEREHL